jgi:hypothetical protein
MVNLPPHILQLFKEILIITFKYCYGCLTSHDPSEWGLEDTEKLRTIELKKTIWIVQESDVTRKTQMQQKRAVSKTCYLGHTSVYK